MKTLKKPNMQSIFLFVAVEEEQCKPVNELKSIKSKNQNEVDEFTEIWEIVKE